MAKIAKKAVTRMEMLERLPSGSVSSRDADRSRPIDGE